MARLRNALVLFSALSLLAGCGHAKVSLADGPREYVPSDYEHVLDRWTRTEQLFALAELDDVLTATATFESWDFRWAYVVRYAHDYRLPIEQRRSFWIRRSRGRAARQSSWRSTATTAAGTI